MGYNNRYMGKVVDSNTGEGVPGAIVQVMEPVGGGGNAYEVARRVVSRPDGSYNIGVFRHKRRQMMRFTYGGNRVDIGGDTFMTDWVARRKGRIWYIHDFPVTP